MAAELLRHQSSRAYYDHNHGCIRGLLRFLDLDKHRRRRKMLAYRRQGDEKHGEGIKLLTSEQNSISNDQERLLDTEANFQMENKITETKKSSGKAHLITLLYKKLTKKHDRKLKNSPSAARLLRTISIHHLECDDYVLPGGMTSETDSSAAELNSHGLDSSASSEQARRIQNTVSDTGAGRAITTEESLQDVVTMADMEQKIRDVIKGEHRISMDGVLDKVPFGHRLIDDAGREEGRGGGSPRSKFGGEGFVSANSKHAHRSLQRSRSLTESLDICSRLLESGSFRESQQLLGRANSVKEHDTNLAQRRVLRSRSLSESFDMYSLLLESSSARESQRLPQRSNSVKEQDGNSARRRVLRSRSLSESMDRYSNLLEFISVREPQKPQKLNSIKEQDNSFAHRGVPRSRSLSESFDRYHLLESISVREHQRLPQRSNSVKEQDDSAVHGRVQRSRSLSETFDRYSQLPASVSVVSPKRQPERLKPIREEDGLQDMKSQMDSERILSDPEPGPFSPSNHVSSEVSEKLDSGMSAGDVKVATSTSDEPNSVSVHANTEEVTEADTFAQHNEEPNAGGTTGGVGEPELSNEPAQIEAYIVSDDPVSDDSRATSHQEDSNESGEDPTTKPLKRSPVSVLGSHFEEDPVSPAKHTDSQGTELQSDWVQLEEEDSDVNPENKLADSDDSRATIDKEQPEFSYVKDLLKKSGFDGGAEEFLDVWCSSYEPVDQLLFVEEEETTKDDSSDMLFDRQLLHDLINEVLLEIYETAIASGTGLLCFSPRTRPVPMGDQLAKEVWEKVGWHLRSQQQASYALEQVEARDYAKDGWMNLQWDVERVGVFLEGLILEDLVDEIIVDFEDA